MSNYRVISAEEAPQARREARVEFERRLPASTSGTPSKDDLDQWYGPEDPSKRPFGHPAL